MVDSFYKNLHVYDVTGLPGRRPRKIADIQLTDDPKWINFTRDGRYAHVSTGEIIDAKSRRVVALTENPGTSCRSTGGVGSPRGRIRATAWVTPASHEPELALRRAEPLDAVGRDEHVLLEPDVAASGHGRPELEREDVSLLDDARGSGAVAVPARAEQRAAVVRRPTELMAERVHRLREARCDQRLARRGVHVGADRSRLQDGDAGVDGRPERLPRGLDLGWSSVRRRRGTRRAGGPSSSRRAGRRSRRAGAGRARAGARSATSARRPCRGRRSRPGSDPRPTRSQGLASQPRRA